MKIDELSEIQKVAIIANLLSENGDKTAVKQIFSHLSDSDAKKVIEQMGEIKSVPIEVSTQLLAEFYLNLSENSVLLFEGVEDSIQQLLDSDRIKKLYGEFGPSVSISAGSELRQTIEMIDLTSLANFLKKEHPQTVAVVIASMPKEKASKLLELMSLGLSADVVQRVSNMDIIAPNVLAQINDILKQEFSNIGSLKGKNRVG